MKTFKKILLCVHPKFTDLDIVDRAARIAKHEGAAIKVMHVVGDYPEDVNEWWNVRDPEKLHAQIVSERQAFLESVVEHVKQQGLEDVGCQLRWGREFLEITHEVMENQHDLVCLTSRRKNKLAKMLFECPSRELLQHCPCGLWVTRGKLHKHFKRIAVALGSTSPEPGFACSGLNAKVLDTGAAVARAEGSELHIIHALPVYGGKGLKGEHLRGDLEVRRETLRQEMRERCSAYLGEAGPPIADEQVHVRPGSPLSVIPDFLAETRMDLLVVGASARRGIPGLIVGNLAEKLLDVLDCGVLSVKPDDFVSIVALEDQGKAKGRARKTTSRAKGRQAQQA